MPSFLDSLLGTKPTVPDLPQLSLGAEQQKALAANIAAIPQSEQIAAKVDLFNQQQVDQMLTKVIPNYKAITGTIAQNLGALNRGEIPTDVSQATARADAARSLAGGYGGTGASRNLTARDLGLTSLQLTQQGLASTESWLKTAASLYQPGSFNVSSMFVTPGQTAAFDVEERNAQFQRQWMQNQIAAQPAMWAQDFKEAVETAISIYSHSGAGVQHAGTMQVQGNIDQGGANNFSGDAFGGAYSPGAGEGGAGFDSEQTALSDYSAGGGMDSGGGGMDSMLG
jgi:hypothetical protein